VKFYADEHIPNSVILGLRLRDIDILSTAGAKMLGADDLSQLRFAESHRRVFITQDADFLRLHHERISHFGMVFVQSNTSIRNFISGILLIARVLDEEEMKNHIEFI
jgi:predicted nuclease of predicted toxin-antitoxin system